MRNRGTTDRLLARPSIDGYLRVCLYLTAGGLGAFVALLGLVLVRIVADLSPLPNAPWIVIAVLVLAGMFGAALVYVLHRSSRQRSQTSVSNRTPTRKSPP